VLERSPVAWLRILHLLLSQSPYVNQAFTTLMPSIFNSLAIMFSDSEMLAVLSEVPDSGWSGLLSFFCDWHTHQQLYWGRKLWGWNIFCCGLVSCFCIGLFVNGSIDVFSILLLNVTNWLTLDVRSEICLDRPWCCFEKCWTSLHTIYLVIWALPFVELFLIGETLVSKLEKPS